MLENHLKLAAFVSLGLGVGGIAARVYDAGAGAAPTDPGMALKADFSRIAGTAIISQQGGYFPAPPHGRIDPQTLTFRILRIEG